MSELNLHELKYAIKMNYQSLIKNKDKSMTAYYKRELDRYYKEYKARGGKLTLNEIIKSVKK